MSRLRDPSSSLRVALAALGAGVVAILAMVTTLLAQLGPAVGLEEWTFAAAAIGILALLTAAFASARADGDSAPGMAVASLLVVALATLAWIATLILLEGDLWFPDCPPTCGR